MNDQRPHLVLEDRIGLCEHFVWGEVLWLNTWKIHVYPTEDQCSELIKISLKLDWIRKHFNKPIHVTSGLRPRIYNQEIGGALNSAHIEGKALDFKVSGISADEVRARLLPFLDRLKIRMEDLPGSSWVHIDNRPRVGNRFFKP